MRIGEHRLTAFPAPRPLQLNYRTLLLAEGSDDLRLIVRLLNLDGLDDVLVVDMTGESTAWAKFLGVSVEDGLFKSHVQRVGLICDADQSPTGKVQRLQAALTSIGWPSPADTGVKKDGQRRGGVFVMPGTGRTGALEDLLLETADVQRVSLARDYLESIATNGLQRPDSAAKGAIQAYMAGLKESPKTLNVGLRGPAFDLQAPALSELRAFLSELAGS